MIPMTSILKTSLLLVQLGHASLPQVEWSWTKAKGDIHNNDEVMALHHVIASLQAQLDALQSGGISQPIPPLTEPGLVPQLSGQTYNYNPAPAMPIMPVMMMPMQNARGLLDGPMDLLKNMSLTITPISKIINSLSGGARHRKAKEKADKSVSVTKVKEVYSPNHRSKTSKLIDYNKGADADCGEVIACRSASPLSAPRPRCGSSPCAVAPPDLYSMNEPPLYRGFSGPDPDSAFLRGLGLDDEDPDSAFLRGLGLDDEDPVARVVQRVNDTIMNVVEYEEQVNRLEGLVADH